jgi:RNA polymerase sigma factor (TIGR02999 family)
MNDLTVILERITSGSMAAEELLPLVYEELRQLAAQKMAREAPGHTLQATALVHEAWLRVGGGNQNWQSRAHFFGAAAEAMRRILIDRARRRRAVMHGGGQERLDIGEVEIAAPAEDDEMFHVHEALDELAVHYPEKAELVKLRYFAGLTLEEAAEVLGIGSATATRYWATSRVWLFRKLNVQRAGGAES